MTIAPAGDGKTPLIPEESTDLIPELSTKEELDEWERKNIVLAAEWAYSRKDIAGDLLTEHFLRRLHAKMFDQTWNWAGQLRKTEKNIGVPVHEIREHTGTLIGDAQFWIQNNTYPIDEVAVRFHHRLVFIHLFPNGNGRHSRLMADLLCVALGGKKFSWGSKDFVSPSEARAAYLNALHAAGQHDLDPLLTFARS
jgi:Fic-DOC domain mobile mystery protein B